MKVFIIGAGFTRAIFSHAPLNAELLPCLAKQPNASASCKLIQRYGITDIEIALTRLDADIALRKTAGGPEDYLSELRHEVEREIVDYFDSDVFSATSDRVNSLPWLCQFLDDAVSEGDVALSLNYGCFFEGALDCRRSVPELSTDTGHDRTLREKKAFYCYPNRLRQIQLPGTGVPSRDFDEVGDRP